MGKALGELNVGCLLAAAATIILDLEGDFIALIEGGHARALKRRNVYEDILAAILRLNEAEAAGVIEEFHGAVDTSHYWDPFPNSSFQITGPGPKGPLAS